MTLTIITASLTIPCFITNHRLCKDSETRVYNNLNSYHSVQNVFLTFPQHRPDNENKC